jgi:BMFP domain-containing protein YqiC
MNQAEPNFEEIAIAQAIKLHQQNDLLEKLREDFARCIRERDNWTKMDRIHLQMVFSAREANAKLEQRNAALEAFAETLQRTYADLAIRALVTKVQYMYAKRGNRELVPGDWERMGSLAREAQKALERIDGLAIENVT